MRKKNDLSVSEVGPAIFQESGDSFAEAMVDRVRALHEHFDVDKDGYLSFEELRSLQLLTSGSDMSTDQYLMVCKALECSPGKGITLDALRLTYAADGTSVDDDYRKVFPERKPKCSQTEKPSNQDDECGVIEVGEGPVDISS